MESGHELTKNKLGIFFVIRAFSFEHFTISILEFCLNNYNPPASLI